MNWDDLRFVLALSRHPTLSGAAKMLGTTHTTVRRRLQGLERALGTTLFTNSDDGYVPTAAGLHVMAAAERTEAELMALESTVLGGDAKLEGTLRVSTMDILFRRYETAFTSFLARFPGVDLTLVCSDVEASLTRREADIALRMTNGPPEHLVGRQIGEVAFAVYASTVLVDRIGHDAPFSDYPWLHWDERRGAHWLDRWLAANAPGARIAMRVDMGSTTLRDVVAAGVGAHFLACSEGDADPRLCRLGGVATSFNRGVWALTLPELRTATRVRAFLDHLASHVASSSLPSSSAPFSPPPSL